MQVDDDTTQVDDDALTAALRRPRVAVWSPVTITMEEDRAFESLHLWVASQPRPFGVLTVDRERAAGLVDPQDRFTCPTLLSADSLAYLAIRQVDDTTWQFGAHGFGPDADTLCGELLDLVAGWNRRYRHGPGPQITVHRARPSSTGGQPQLLVSRRHSTVAVTWPGVEGRA